MNGKKRRKIKTFLNKETDESLLPTLCIRNAGAIGKFAVFVFLFSFGYVRQ